MIKTVTPARAAEILREHGMRTSAETLKYGSATYIVSEIIKQAADYVVFKDLKHGDIQVP